MRNPTGYGSIIKLGGKRRKPFAVRITSGWTEDGKQIYKYLGYYEKSKDANQALAEYNANPYDVNANKVTFAELYEKFSKEKFTKISYKNMQGYEASYRLCETLYNMRFVDIKKAHLQAVIDNSGKTHSILRKLKVMLSQLTKYAIENDVAHKDYTQFLDIGKNEKPSDRKPFTNEEINLLFQNANRMEWIDTILIMIYTGVRIGELLTIKNADINLDEGYMRGGIKTAAGKNRVIPISSKILPFVTARYNPDNEFFITHQNKQLSYHTYRDSHWRIVMEQLCLDHKPHDCRHTFATLMDNAGANKLAIKRIMGHSSIDITDKVYTHKDIGELIKAVDLI